jgi:S1-C subfamily serine protease
VVSFVGRRFGKLRLLQTDLPILPGNSGGPVFDDSGRVVALMASVLRREQRIAFAIPVDYALELFTDLLPQQRERGGQAEAFSRWRQRRIEGLPPSPRPSGSLDSR